MDESDLSSAPRPPADPVGAGAPDSPGGPPAVGGRRGGRLHDVLAAPGAPALLLARTVGTMPVGMVSLGIILLLRAAGRSYALAGVADGAFALGVAAMGPVLGRLIDRAGMARVVAPLAVLFPSATVAVALAGSSAAPGALIVALALAAGATMPPLGACMRALWPVLIESPAQLPAAFAIDAVLQELAFVLGPPLLALLVALASPRVALLVAAAAGGTGSLVFAALARARHAPTRRASGALRSRGVRRLLAVSALLGGSFGATEVAMPAFCEHHGARAAAGLILAALALGSAFGGSLFGARAPRVSAPRRLLIALASYGLLLTPLLAAPSIAVMALLAFVTGMPIAPAFAGTYVLLDRFSVQGAATETFAWNSTCIFAGAALGTAVGGALIAPASYRAPIGLGAALAAGCVLALAGYSRRGVLER